MMRRAPLQSRPMLQHHHHRRLAAWVSLVAMLLATLAPGIARALALAQADVAPWGRICSVGAGDDSGGTPADPAAHLLDHCPLCSPHGNSLGLPPARLAVAAAPGLADGVPPLRLHSERAPQAWASAQPRAPPTCC